MEIFNAKERQDIRKQADKIAFVAAELYSALLAARSPDIAGRGIVNFDKNQAFELTRSVLYEACKDKDL